MCSIYNVYFRTFADENEPSVGDDFCSKPYFILGILPYSVQRNQKEGGADYEVLGSNDRKESGQTFGIRHKAMGTWACVIHRSAMGPLIQGSCLRRIELEGRY